MKKISPCSTCPWRKDAPRQHWDPAHFKSIWASCQDDGLALMLCHKSRPKDGVEIPCAGAILVVGFNAIGLRLAAIRGRINPADYSAGKLKLFPTFEAMLRANKVRIPRRNTFLEKIR